MFKIDEYIKLDLLQIRYHIKGLCWYYSPEAKLLILSFNILSNADRRYQFWYFYLSFYSYKIHEIICRRPDYIGDPNYDCLVQDWLQYLQKNWSRTDISNVYNVLKHPLSLLVSYLDTFIFSYHTFPVQLSSTETAIKEFL